MCLNMKPAGTILGMFRLNAAHSEPDVLSGLQLYKPALKRIITAQNCFCAVIFIQGSFIQTEYYETAALKHPHTYQVLR